MLKVILLSYTPMPTLNVVNAAKLCYSPSNIEDLRDSISDDEADRFVELLSSMGHFSPIEHVNFTFGIEGVSRALLAQLTRHRIASYSVKSQRYVNESKFDFVIPPHIENDEDAKAIYLKAMQDDIDAYNSLVDILKKKHLKHFLSEKVDEKKANNMAEKVAIEDARYVLPNACETKLVMTMNARSLINFFEKRCCLRAQWEIKQLADEMLSIVYKKAPALFKKSGPSCVKGACSEGKMTCGKILKVREYYKELKNELDSCLIGD